MREPHFWQLFPGEPNRTILYCTYSYWELFFLATTVKCKSLRPPAEFDLNLVITLSVWVVYMLAVSRRRSEKCVRASVTFQHSHEKIVTAWQRNIHLLEMGRNASLAKVQRASIVLLHDDGYSKRWFPLKMRCSKTAVNNAIRELEQDGRYSDKKRLWRAREKVVAWDQPWWQHDEAHCCKISNKFLKDSSRNVTSKWILGEQQFHSTSLEQRISPKSSNPALEPMLTGAMKIRRLDFARRHQNRMVAKWHLVLFSDAAVWITPSTH
jgi:hypothetical protein